MFGGDYMITCKSLFTEKRELPRQRVEASQDSYTFLQNNSLFNEQMPGIWQFFGELSIIGC